MPAGASLRQAGASGAAAPAIRSSRRRATLPHARRPPVPCSRLPEQPRTLRGRAVPAPRSRHRLEPSRHSSARRGRVWSSSYGFAPDAGDSVERLEKAVPDASLALEGLPAGGGQPVVPAAPLPGLLDPPPLNQIPFFHAVERG